MKIASSALGVLPLVFATGLWAQVAQPVPTDDAQIHDEWITELAAFVEDARFDAGDVKKFVAYYDEFSALDDEFSALDDEIELGEQREADESMMDFDRLLAYEPYRQWAAAKGLDADRWLRKSMRIIAVVMGDQMRAGLAEAGADLPEQLAELEKLRSQLGEEMYQQMRQTMETSAGAMQSAEATAGKLPRPTPTERAALELHREDLTRLLGAE